MQEILNEYVEVSFGEKKQDQKKIKQFEYNYRKFFPIDTNSLVVDIGIGRGEMLTSTKNWGYVNSLGVDISKSTVDFCKSLNLNCIYVEDSNEWLLNNANKCSILTLLDVLEHIPRELIIDFLKSLKNALSFDGKLIIQVPNMQANHSNLHMYQDITHQVGFTEHSLRQVLSAAGLEVITFDGFENQIGNPMLNPPRRIVRSIIWFFTRLSRRVQGTLSPKILHPVIFVVVRAIK
jgi:2-polyprenyl-3-methyl-5-hydroxy-6-metoxy-1,4-benzoquinol methylase